MCIRDSVEPSLGVGLLRDQAQPRRQVVDQGGVGDAPGAGVEGQTVRRPQRRSVRRREDAGDVTPGAAGIGQPQQHLAGVDGPPPLGEEALDIAVVGEHVEEFVAVALAHLPPCLLYTSRCV